MREPSELAVIGAAAVEHGQLKRKWTALGKTAAAYAAQLLRVSGELQMYELPNIEAIENLPTSEMVLANLTEIRDTRKRIEELEGLLRTAGCALDAVQHRR